MAFRLPPVPPRTEADLLRRADGVAGRTFEEIAEALDLRVPRDLTRAKGWVGTLIEQALGATASNRPEPDFPGLGVELKTVPVDPNGHPRESTFVCSIALSDLGPLTWADSRVKKKLDRVLWVPIEADPMLPLATRRVGNPLLWSPSQLVQSELRADWLELATLIADGHVDAITADRGKHLHVRPKAANARARRWANGADGQPMRTLPRGFYLRASFTAAILAAHFVNPG